MSNESIYFNYISIHLPILVPRISSLFRWSQERKEGEKLIIFAMNSRHCLGRGEFIFHDWSKLWGAFIVSKCWSILCGHITGTLLGRNLPFEHGQSWFLFNYNLLQLLHACICGACKNVHWRKSPIWIALDSGTWVIPYTYIPEHALSSLCMVWEHSHVILLLIKHPWALMVLGKHHLTLFIVVLPFISVFSSAEIIPSVHNRSPLLWNICCLDNACTTFQECIPLQCHHICIFICCRVCPWWRPVQYATSRLQTCSQPLWKCNSTKPLGKPCPNLPCKVNWNSLLSSSWSVYVHCPSLGPSFNCCIFPETPSACGEASSARKGHRDCQIRTWC